MKPVLSTAEILVFRMLNRNIDKRWIDWAYEMICVGYEAENLTEFAGETEPYNQFELQQLADKVFAELFLRWDNPELVYRNYIYYLNNKALNGEMTTLDVLSIIKDVCIGQGYDSLLIDFYLLYWAYDDLKYSEIQNYWDGATRENIDAITKAYFEEWIAKYKTGD